MSEASVSHDRTPLRVLIVDESADFRDSLAAPLSEEAICAPDVVTLTAGRLALELLRGSTFDIVVADADSLADIGDRPETAIHKLARTAVGSLLLALAPNSSVSFALAAMRAGAHECVERNTTPGGLVQRMVGLARRHGKAGFFHDAAIPPARPSSGEREPSIPVMSNLVLPMWRQEQRIIEDAIHNFAGNVALAAAALELSPSTIYRKRQAWADLDHKRSQLAAAGMR
ncbi:MAG: helix-turn-helix domain-containing protein [Devosia sp.]